MEKSDHTNKNHASEREPHRPESSAPPQSGASKGTRKTQRIDVIAKIEAFLASEHEADQAHQLHMRTLRFRKDLQPGDVVDYELIGVLGVGGMGTVYEARQNSTGRVVALKLLEKKDETVRHEFAREAILTANLEHPNIIRLYEFAVSEEFGLFYAMELIEGEPWSDVIDEQSHPEKLEVFMRVLDAVAYAHSCGMIHRDLKPSNIMLGEFGNILLVDWGLALSREELEADLTLPNLYGSLSYMSPEMLSQQTKDLGVHSDIFMLGAVLYEIMTGHPPHNAEGGVRERVNRIRENQIEPVKSFPLLSKIALNALATLPEDRYASVDEFQQALQHYQQYLSVQQLVRNGRRHLKEGRVTKSLQSLTRAFFSFQEALEIAPESETAKKAFLKAEEALAQTALELGDVAYAYRISSSASFRNMGLKQEILRTRQQMQLRAKRTRLLSWAAALAGILLLVLLSAGLAFMRNEKQKTDEALRIARKERSNALEALQQLQDQKGLTRLAREDAETAETIARAAEDVATYERMKSLLFTLNKQVESGMEPWELIRQLREIPSESRGREWEILMAGSHPWMHEWKLDAPVTATTFSGDGSLLLVATETGLLELIDPLWGTRLRRYLPHTEEAIQSLALDEQHARIAILSRKGELFLVDALRGEPIQIPDRIESARYRSIYASEGALHLWTTSNQWIRLTVGNGLTGLARLAPSLQPVDEELSPYGKHLVVVDADRLYVLSTDREPVQVALPHPGPLSVQWGPDGREITVLYREGMVSHHAPSGKQTGGAQLPEPTVSGWHPVFGSERVLVSTDSPAGLQFWDRSGQQFLPELPLSGRQGIRFVASDPVTGLILTAPEPGTLRAWSHLRLSPEVYPSGNDDRIQVTGFSDEEGVLVHGTRAGELIFRNLFQMTDPRVFSVHNGPVNTLTVDQERDWVLSGGEDGRLNATRVSDGQRIHTFTGHTRSVTSVDSKGTLMVSGDEAGQVVIHNVESGEILRQHRIHQEPVRDVAFATDSAVWASGDAEGRVCLWNPEKEMVTTLVDLKQPVSRLAWLGPEALLVGDDQGTVHLYNTRDGLIQARHDVGPRPVSLLYGLPLNRWVAGSASTAPTIWSQRDDKPLSLLPVSVREWSEWTPTAEGMVLTMDQGGCYWLPATPDLDLEEIPDMLSRQRAVRLDAVRFEPDQSSFTGHLNLTLTPLDPERPLFLEGEGLNAAPLPLPDRLNLYQDRVVRIGTEGEMMNFKQTRFYHLQTPIAGQKRTDLQRGVQVGLSSESWLMVKNPIEFEAEERKEMMDLGVLPFQWMNRDQSRSRYTGYLYIPRTGQVFLSMSTSSRGVMRLHNEAVLSSGEFTGTESRKRLLTLEKGYHPYEAVWFRDSDEDEFQIRIGFPGEQPEPLRKYLYISGE